MINGYITVSVSVCYSLTLSVRSPNASHVLPPHSRKNTSRLTLLTFSFLLELCSVRGSRFAPVMLPHSPSAHPPCATKFHSLTVQFCQDFSVYFETSTFRFQEGYMISRRKQSAAPGHVEAEDVVHVQRQADDQRVVGPVVGEERQRQRPDRDRRQDAPPRRRRTLDQIVSADRPLPVLELGGRYARVRRRRVVAEQRPGDRPDAADSSEGVEGGRPAGAVAEDARQQHADHDADVRARVERADDAGTAARRRPAGNHCVERRQQRAFAESAKQAESYQQSDVDSCGGGRDEGHDRGQENAAAAQPFAAKPISHRATRHLDTNRRR